MTTGQREHEQREYDVVVWGATGFTGRLVAEHLLRRYGVAAPGAGGGAVEGAAERGELRWAIGGRNRAKLAAVRDEIARETGADASALPLLQGDSDDEASLDAIARRTRVVCTTVGPYAKYGSKLVAACVRAGTDYCDLTGEVQWIRRMIERHEDEAQQSGARIVFTCGFDCIPSDLGTFFVQREMLARHGVPASHVKYRVAGFSGGVSGGTVASMLEMMEEASRDPEVRRVVAAPYSLNPKDQRTGPDGADRLLPALDPDFGQWTAPFVMAAIDTKVVRRSNALLGFLYGKDFRYDEAMLTGAGARGLAKALALCAGTAAGMGAMAIGPVRRLVGGRLPAPGEGPSKSAREAGYFDVLLHAAHPTDPARSLRARVRGDRDPGYGSTSKMLGESAVCLAQRDHASAGGCSTPAAAMGEALIERLQRNAGLTFSLEPIG